jgi:hypothetical protein
MAADLKLTNGDLDITAGELTLVGATPDDVVEGIRQDIEMEMGTWLGECRYDRAAGLPFLQVIFVRGTTATAIRFILTSKLLSLDGVTDVLTLDTALDTATRELVATGTVLANGAEVDFRIGAITP